MKEQDIAAVLTPVIEKAVETRTATLEARVKDIEDKNRERPTLTAALETSLDGKTWSPAATPRFIERSDGSRFRSWGGSYSIPGIDTRRFSFARAVKAMAFRKRGDADPWKGAGYEHDVFKEIGRQRAITLGNDAQAGFLIPNEIMDEIIDNLRPQSIQAQLGVQMMTGLTSSPIQIRRRTASTTAYWVGESTAITESIPTYDRLNLTPKKCGVLSDVSGDLFRKDPALVESEIRQDIAYTLRLKEEVGFFEGTGATGQPIGLDNITGVNSITAITTTAAADLQSFMTMVEEVDVDNVNLEGAKWVMHARAWHNISQALSTTVANTIGQPILSYGGPNPQGSFQAMASKTFLGFPVIICNSLTASTTTIVKFIVPREIIWAEWGNPEIRVSDEAGSSFANDEVLVRILHEVDVAARHPEAICKVVYTF